MATGPRNTDTINAIAGDSHVVCGSGWQCLNQKGSAHGPDAIPRDGTAQGFNTLWISFYLAEEMAITLFEHRPYWKDKSIRTKSDVARVRYSKTDGTWTLYFKDRNEK